MSSDELRNELRHTWQLEPGTLAEARALMDLVFRGDFDDSDWEHALGGLHVLVWAGAQLVGHGSVVQRRLLHGGRALRCGYVESIGVHPEHRRRGHARTVMTELGRVVQGAFELGALGATDEAVPLYERHGWRHWSGELHALTPDGVVRTEDADGAVMVLAVPGVELDLTARLTCDWRDGDVW